MARTNRRERSMLSRLRKLREHTEVLGEISSDLRKLLEVIATLSVLGVALHQFVTLLR
ncbi:hypothetical protein [Jiangella sp. DSM 45060]|uniref:hypothetical protein n=1 Tax=Jiangella sp. DSM 45060 TaxID=1798224 RepID=UPI00087CE6A8|nr:hypothetical protein [Jiangella sp. DSM 45060]SDS05143.1 hypothetical protein SAMN04515669_0221 [Jiangella sp. DSM 45060]